MPKQEKKKRCSKGRFLPIQPREPRSEPPSSPEPSYSPYNSDEEEKVEDDAPPAYEQDEEEWDHAKMISNARQAEELFRITRQGECELRRANSRLIDKAKQEIANFKNQIKVRQDAYYDMVLRDDKYDARIVELEALMDQANAHAVSVDRYEVGDPQERQQQIADLLYRAKKQE